MRADRLLSLVLLLQQRGRMPASALARELEVSTRTVLRDVDALSAAGIPVYAERGRRGGFALLPGFSTDLTGLTHPEALALLVAGSRAAPESLGMAPALASAMRKVVAALPPQARSTATRAAERVLVRPDGWFPREAASAADDGADERLGSVQHAVFAGRRLRIRYAAAGESARWRTVDPVGLVNARGRWYLLATHRGAERTYRVSRMLAVRELDEPADRAGEVDLDRAWQQRQEGFKASRPTVAATVRVRARRRPELVRAALGTTAELPDRGGWLRLELTFGGLGHARAVLWELGPDVEAIAPAELRAGLAQRAAATAALYRAP